MRNIKMKITKLQKTPLSNVDEIVYKPIQKIYYSIFKDKLFYLVIFLIIILLIILKI